MPVILITILVNYVKYLLKIYLNCSTNYVPETNFLNLISISFNFHSPGLSTRLKIQWGIIHYSSISKIKTWYRWELYIFFKLFLLLMKINAKTIAMNKLKSMIHIFNAGKYKPRMTLIFTSMVLYTPLTIQKICYFKILFMIYYIESKLLESYKKYPFQVILRPHHSSLLNVDSMESNWIK